MDGPRTDRRSDDAGVALLVIGYGNTTRRWAQLQVSPPPLATHAASSSELRKRRVDRDRKRKRRIKIREERKAETQSRRRSVKREISLRYWSVLGSHNGRQWATEKEELCFTRSSTYPSDLSTDARRKGSRYSRGF